MARPRGERIPQSRLTEGQVRAIRLAYVRGMTLTKLAAQYGVAVSTVFHVVRRNTWRHVD